MPQVMTQEQTKEKRPRGTGSIYKPTGSRFWWIKYYRGGTAYRESSHSTTRIRAERMLAKRLGQISTGVFAGPQVERILVDELAQDVLSDYKVKERKTWDATERRWRLHLKPFFGGMRAADVTTALINQYIEKRQLEQAENGSINRELGVLRRMFNLAARCSPPKLNRVPTFTFLPENNTRMGFISDPDYNKLVEACSDLWLRTILAIGCTYGWRKQEILKLRVRQVDLFSRKITLNPGTTKNREGRVAPVTDELFPLLAECIAGKGQDDYVLTREGRPVRDFRKAWNALFRKAGVERRLIHDMRRTGAMHLDRSGISRTVAKQIGGWKTDSIYERYRIVSEADLQDAGKKLDRRNGQSLGIVEPKIPQTNTGKSVSVV